jgi:Myb-like DNA-binding domain
MDNMAQEQNALPTLAGLLQLNPGLAAVHAAGMKPLLSNDAAAYGAQFADEEERNEVDEKGGRRKRSVRKWSPEEDHLMVHLVREHGTRQWGLIGSLLNGRTGKQCRER